MHLVEIIFVVFCVLGVFGNWFLFTTHFKTQEVEENLSVLDYIILVVIAFVMGTKLFIIFLDSVYVKDGTFSVNYHQAELDMKKLF